MEVLFVSHKYPPAIGGMEKHSFELIQGMRNITKVHTLVFEGSESRLSFFYHLQDRIVQMLAQHPNIKVIHFNDGLLASFCSFHTQYDHIAQTVTLHGLDIVFPSKLFRKYIIPRFNKYKALICVSEETAKQTKSFGIRPELVYVVPNGVDTEIPKGDRIPAHLEGKNLLILMGRPVKRKGFSWFIENVVPKVASRYHTVIIGPFHKKGTFSERLIHALGDKVMLFLGYPSDEIRVRKLLKSHTNVEHLGKLPTETIQALFSRASAFVMPNIKVQGDMEGFGLVCLEASVGGALVLASDIDGIPSAIQHNNNGILIPAGDVDAWVKNIQNLEHLNLNREQFTNFTKANYSWEIMVRAYYQIFKNLV